MQQNTETDSILESMPRRQLSNKLVGGIGFNDSSFCIGTKIKGVVVMHRAYSAWCEMIKRCYNEKFHTRQPTYIGCEVESDWRKFSSFYKWWSENYREGMHLDKDILVIGNKTYGADYCVYVPSKINGLVSLPNKRGSTGYIGASLRKDTGKFVATGTGLDGKVYQIGVFSNPIDAHQAWHDQKLKSAMEHKGLCDEIRHDLYSCLIAKIMSYKQY